MTSSLSEQPPIDPQMEQDRQDYQYQDYHGVAIAKSLPAQESSLRNLPWIQQVAMVIIRILTNRRLNSNKLNPFSTVLRSAGLLFFLRIVKNAQPNGWLQRIYEFLMPLLNWLLNRTFRRTQDANPHPDKAAELEDALNHEEQPPTSGSTSTDPFKPFRDLFQIIYLPCISQHFLEDRAFAAYRVAGPNPLVIEQIQSLPAHFPVTEAQYQAVMGETDTLSQAGAEGRLYLADYKVMDRLEAGTLPRQKFKYAPLALFAVPQGTGPNRSLQPIAIQCQQIAGPNNPIFTPPAPATPFNQRWSWTIAKTIVQIADGNYHELISHLGRTHLWIEPFVIATHRELPDQHPLRVLLLPHFVGTMFINNGAVNGLINEGGPIDKGLLGTIDSAIALTAEGVQGYPATFNQSTLPQDLARRQVNDPNTLPDYPYRDDGLLIWEAIYDWVSDYLNLFYTRDQDVCADQLLQNWIQSLVAEDQGKLIDVGEQGPNQPGAIHTLAYLIEAITLVIFTASAQHAAVNFPQASLMSYVPSMPLVGFQPSPTTAEGATQRDYFDLIPSLEETELQMNMTYGLGSIYYTRLGQYDVGHFDDPRVKAPLERFQNRLQEVERIIVDRNHKRPTFYNFLSPSQIPQSINI